MPPANPRQQILMTIAALIWIALLIYTLYSGEFGRMSAIRKAIQVFLAVFGVYWLWLAWRDRPGTGAGQR